MARGVLIGIAGGSASGKTLVAQRIWEALGTDRVLIVKQDSYYRDLSHLDPGDRARQNFDHPDAFDADLLLTHLGELLDGGFVEEPVYDFNEHRRLGETRRVGGVPVVVLEGILILSDERLREQMDIKVYVETDADIRLLRRLRRDVEDRGRTVTSVLNQYERSVRPMHLQFVEPSKRYADVIIPAGGNNRVAVDLLKTKIASVLTEKWSPGAREEAGGPVRGEPAGSGGPAVPGVPKSEPAAARTAPPSEKAAPAAAKAPTATGKGASSAAKPPRAASGSPVRKPTRAKSAARPRGRAGA